MIEHSVGEASREILWNVNSTLTVVGMYGSLALALLVGFTGVWRHVELWQSGQKPLAPQETWGSRISNFVVWVLFQRGVARDKKAGLSHSLIYIGFLVLLFTTTMVMIDHDFGIPIYRGEFYLLLTIASDIFGLGLLLGCGLAAHRRYIKHEPRIHNRAADASMLIVLSMLVVQGFLLEGLRIHVTNDPWRWYSPVGLLVSKFFWPLSYSSAEALHQVIWWIHTLNVMLVVALAPYTKFFHIVASSINLFFRPQARPKGQLESVGDLEKRMEAGEEFTIGLGNIKDYSWKHLMDLDACTSCGRCQEVCPAYLSGKPLSPKWMILDSRNHALSLLADNKLKVPSKIPSPLRAIDSWFTKNLLLAKSGLVETENGYEANGPYRAKNTLVQQATKEVGKNVEHMIAGEVVDDLVYWSCTTCRACVEVCPVGINHVDHIVGNRRNMVLMRGEVPSEAQGTLRALENRANPYGPPQDRMKWAEGLDLPVLKPGDSVDYLYWVGCVSAFDPRKQKIAKALVKLMKAAGLSFGVLGTAEGCTGDPARRLGEENLFQSLAKKNLEVLRSVQFRTLVANCPHCFNSIKNEYPEFGNLGNGQSPEIIHHSQLLKRLLKDGRLPLKEQNADTQQTYTFHDPCYLGRYNDEYEAPRTGLKKIKSLQIVEMDRSRESGLCCGAGGGHFWMDLKVGERVNSLRVDEAAATGAQGIATACPFCMQMLEDGVKLTGREQQLEVKDIAELLAEQL